MPASTTGAGDWVREHLRRADVVPGNAIAHLPRTGGAKQTIRLNADEGPSIKRVLPGE